MKTLILLIFLLPFIAFSQEPPIGTKKIIVQTDLPAKEGFYLIANYLLDNGYEIKSKDTELFLIETKSMIYQSGRTTTRYLVNIRSKDDKLIITGKWISGYNTGIIEKKLPSKWFIDMFIPLQNFAGKINKPLTYSN